MKNTIAPLDGQIGLFLTDMRERAVDVARRGFRVFKLGVNSKLPAVERFYEVASSDPKRVREMWTCPVSGDSLDNNIGIATGDGLVVLDVDVRKRPTEKQTGKQRRKSAGAPHGLDALRKLKKDWGLSTKTIKARTPSGGHHFYYSLPPSLRMPNSASAIAPGIDVRGHHGYVAAPGSVINGREYVWEVEDV